ncbi:MAG: RNA polymerase factor sigma-32 [Rhodospirillales bacterium]
MTASSQTALSRADTDFLRKAMNAPLLERQEEIELAKAWRERSEDWALHRLIDSHMRLVAAVASRYRAYGLSLPDMVQEGSLGLLQAANRFEPERGVRFSTYASWWIRSSIQDYILRNWSIVRAGTTSTQKSLFFNLRRLRAQIERNTGRPLDSTGRESIAKSLKVAQRDVETMEGRIGGPDQSLNATVGEDADLERQDLVRDDRPGPEDLIIGVRDGAARTRWLDEALAELTARERVIIEQRRLLDVGRTLEDLGKVLGVSKERVRQLESRALKKLRVALSKKVEISQDLLLEG